MITLARRVLPVCALAVALGVSAACTATDERGASRAPRPAPSASAASPFSPAAEPPTLAPGPAGLTPVFEHGPRNRGKAVALTFDADMTAGQGARADGGERFDNPRLVATLRRLKVPATVFMTGRWAEEYPAQARSIGRDPLFEVANHSYSHYAFTDDCYGLPALPESRMRSDVERAYRAFRKVGVRDAMPYFRFPGGCHDRRALKALTQAGVTAVQWDVVSGDAFATDAGAVARQVLREVRSGSVVVMHCTLSAAPTTERAVRAIVPRLRERGFRFVKVSDLIAAGAGRA
ncbi:polysaccharide deacetylase family protein [Streptomyces sp. M41]|uniref:polysaccharide deacetylase family protein n=1 Tax=Streptomyces sp. M41 TaxID=3059412 RepID=UPI00374D35AD